MTDTTLAFVTPFRISGVVRRAAIPPHRRIPRRISVLMRLLFPPPSGYSFHEAL
jgi:hypothetical protein